MLHRIQSGFVPFTLNHEYIHQNYIIHSNKLFYTLNLEPSKIYLKKIPICYLSVLDKVKFWVLTLRLSSPNHKTFNPGLGNFSLSET